MSELKEFDVRLGQYSEDGSPCVVAFDADQNPRLLDEKVYLKSDVDKYIEEIDEKHFNDLQDAEDSFKSVIELNRKEIKHQKYKRCMDKVKLCELDMEEWDEDSLRWQRRNNCRKRWLELAEKFKEAK